MRAVIRKNCAAQSPAHQMHLKALDEWIGKLRRSRGKSPEAAAVCKSRGCQNLKQTPAFKAPNPAQSSAKIPKAGLK